MSELDEIAGRYEETNRVGSDAQFMEVAGEYVEALAAALTDEKANSANLARVLVEVSDALTEAEHRAERAENALRGLMFAAQGTAELDWVTNRCAAALDTTDGLAEKLGASHVEQHGSHAAAVRAGKARIDGLTAGPGGSDKPGRT